MLGWITGLQFFRFIDPSWKKITSIELVAASHRPPMLARGFSCSQRGCKAKSYWHRARGCRWCHFCHQGGPIAMALLERPLPKHGKYGSQLESQCQWLRIKWVCLDTVASQVDDNYVNAHCPCTELVLYDPFASCNYHFWVGNNVKCVLCTRFSKLQFAHFVIIAFFKGCLIGVVIKQNRIYKCGNKKLKTLSFIVRFDQW